MGSGAYSSDAHAQLLQGRAHRPAEQVFTQRAVHPLMNPKGVRVRECRDSADHPTSLGIVFALDVTGSMGAIPKALATTELPRFMSVLIGAGVTDPQLCFMAVGDALHDVAGLQVGQFESTAALMDQWLTSTWLEGGGGGNGRESYELALYFCAQHVEMDCVVKRQHRGYLFLTGDELPYDTLSRHVVETVVGDALDDDLKLAEIVAELQKSFVPFFLIPDASRRQKIESTWRAVLGDHVLCMEDPRDVCFVAAGALLIGEGLTRDEATLSAALTRGGLGAGRRGAVLQTLRPLLTPPAPAPGPEEPGLLQRLFSAIGR